MSYLVSGNMCFQYALANKRGTVFGTKVGVEKYPCYDIDAERAAQHPMAKWRAANIKK